MAKIILNFVETPRGDVEFTARAEMPPGATEKEKAYIKAVVVLLNYSIPEIGEMLGAKSAIFHKGKPADS